MLVDEDGRITGVIDFGDASWSALVVDLAAVLETVVDGREADTDEFFRAGRLAIDGYERVTPLEPDERAIVGELLAARMCAAIVIPASRAALYDDRRSAHGRTCGAQACQDPAHVRRRLAGTTSRRRLGGRGAGQRADQWLS